MSGTIIVCMADLCGRRGNEGPSPLRPATAAAAAFKSLPAIRLPGSLIPIGFHRALTVCQDARRDSADLLHISPFAPTKGLAVVFNGREDDRKKSKCPTKEFPISEKEFPRTT